MEPSPVSPVLVDLAAAPAPPSDSDLRAYMAIQRAFISSVMAGLESERRAVATTVEELGAEPVWFETFGGRDADPEDAYLAEVNASTIYVGILGQRYGKLHPNRFSATHMEYLAAEAGGLRVAVWTHADEDWDGRQESFVQEVREFHTTGKFSSADDLALSVRRRLMTIAAQDLSPWCKIGQIIFRASRIGSSSNGIEVTATVRDARVAFALESLRPGGWSQEQSFTDPFGSARVRVREVATTAVSASAREFTLYMDVVPNRADPFPDMSFQTGGVTYSPDDLTELALREHLFGETNTSGTSSFVSIPNPFQNFPVGLPDEIVRPVARLFLTEALVGSGRASRIKNFRLGTRVAGARRLVLEWQGASRYSNPPPTKLIDGVVAL